MDVSKAEEIPWPKADEIRWVQWRIRERKSIQSGKPTAPPSRKSGKYKISDYQAWLLRQPEGFAELSKEEILELFPAGGATIPHSVPPISFQKIGDLLFAELDEPDNRKKRAADAFNRVESEFRRGSLKRGR